MGTTYPCRSADARTSNDRGRGLGRGAARRRDLDPRDRHARLTGERAIGGSREAVPNDSCAPVYDVLADASRQSRITERVETSKNPDMPREPLTLVAQLPQLAQFDRRQ